MHKNVLSRRRHNNEWISQRKHTSRRSPSSTFIQSNASHLATYLRILLEDENTIREKYIGIYIKFYNFFEYLPIKITKLDRIFFFFNERLSETRKERRAESLNLEQSHTDLFSLSQPLHFTKNTRLNQIYSNTIDVI